MSKLMAIDSAPIVALRSLGTSRVLTITGDVWAERLKHYLLFQFVRAERKAQFICADNRIDVAMLARMARGAGLDDEEILRAVELSRAFTAYQLTELVLRLDESLIGQLVIISDPCALFFDDDLKPVEAGRFFYRMMWHIAGLAWRGMKFLITHHPQKHLKRAYFSRDLMKFSETVLHLVGGTSMVVERHELPAGCFFGALPAATEAAMEAGG